MPLAPLPGKHAAHLFDAFESESSKGTTRSRFADEYDWFDVN
jgi:hypothetical protein